MNEYQSGIKFRSDQDKLRFLTDINRLDLINEKIPDEQFELFIKKRKPFVKRLKDYRKSNITKQAWKKYRWKYLRGIKRWHKSIKGKQFHRNMGRFLATRLFKTKEDFNNDIIIGEALKASTSMKTHFFIESEYYSPLHHHTQFLGLLEYCIPLLSNIERKLYNCNFNNLDPYELNINEIEMLIRLLGPNKLITQITNIINIEEDKLNESLGNIMKNHLDKDDTFFMVESFKKLGDSFDISNENFRELIYE